MVQYPEEYIAKLFAREKRGKKEVRDLHRKEVRDLHRKEVRDLHRMGS